MIRDVFGRADGTVHLKNTDSSSYWYLRKIYEWLDMVK